MRVILTLNLQQKNKINGGLEIFVEFNKRGGQGGQNKPGGGVGISKYPLISVTNEKRDINVQMEDGG